MELCLRTNFSAKTNIIGAASDTNAFVSGGLTGLYPNNDYGIVNSPCFDFTTIVRPQVQLNVWWDSENGYDGANLQFSLDGGNTWAVAGDFGQGDNWYTDNSINGTLSGMPAWTGRGTTGSNGWKLASLDMSFLGGYSSVNFRVVFGSDGSVDGEGFAFDDFSIFESPFIGADTVLCANGTMTLDAGVYDSYFWNDSSNTQFNYIDANLLEAGVQMFDVVVSGTGGYKMYDTIVVTVEKPEINLGADSILCYGTSMTLGTGSGFASYLWSTGETTSTILTSSSTVGTTEYYVNASTANNCLATDTIDVSVNTKVLVNLGVDTIFSDSNLQDTFYELDAGAGFSSYLWSEGSTTRKLIIDSNNDGLVSVVVTNVSGCEGSDSVIVDFRLSVGSNLEVSTITMYPNPTSDVINIEVSNFNNLDNVNVTILDLSGKVVMTNKLVGNGNSFNQTYDVSSFATGTYFVQFEANGEVITRQFIIK
jgi:hypothetical protein